MFAVGDEILEPLDEPPSPPADRERPFGALAVECSLEETLQSAYDRLQRFWNNVRAM